MEKHISITNSLITVEEIWCLASDCTCILLTKLIYKFMTLLPKDYYLIPSNDAKNLLTKSVYIQIYDTVTKEYYLFSSSGAKNLLTNFST